MARIRIVTAPHRPPAPPNPGWPTINGVMPSWTDVSITAIDDAGNETPIPGVTSVALHFKEGTEVLEATLTFVDIEIDVEVEAAD